MLIIPLIRRLMYRLSDDGWRFPAIIVAATFAIGWILQVTFEPTGAEIASGRSYWYWWFTSATTTGFGDISPESTGGRIGFVFVMIGALTGLASLFANLSNSIAQSRRRRMTGLAKVHMTNHVLVLGCGSLTKILGVLDELASDPGSQQSSVVLGFYPGQLPGGENPYPKRFDVVDLSSPDWADKANIDAARAILVDTGDDDKGYTLIALLLNRFKSKGLKPPHITFALADAGRLAEFEGLFASEASIDLVTFNTPPMLADAIQNPGVARIYQSLASNLDKGASAYRLEVTAGQFTWRDLVLHLMSQNIGVLAVINPKADNALHLVPEPRMPIGAGMAVVVIAHSRPRVNWSAVGQSTVNA